MIYTIGYQRITMEKLIEIIGDNSVDLVVDVRSHPYSRNPDKQEFNKNRMSKQLEEEYLWLGDLCGGKTGRPVTEKCVEKIYEDLHYGRGFNLMLMCMENHPCDCHRMYDISRRLMKKGEEVYHLHFDFEGNCTEQKTAELSEKYCRERRKKK